MPWCRLLVTLACSGSSTPVTQQTKPPLDAGVPVDAGVPARTVWYYGGPVVPNPKVYVLWWGPPAQINPDLTRADGGMVDFFTGATNSNLVDGLNEYNTDGVAEKGSDVGDVGDAGTHQRIGRGNFAGAYVLDAGTSDTVDDGTIAATLGAAQLAGKVPASDDNAVYAIFFPPGVTVTSAGAVSCVQFGAYHYFTPPQPDVIAYLVIPDCGFGFDELTSATAYELVESMTDRLPTPGSNPDYPQAWNTFQGDEVVDLCENDPLVELSTPNGSFKVEQVWDEEHQTCALTHAYDLDYNVSFSPNVTTLLSESPVTVAVQTAIVAGSDQALVLSVRAPPGITATLSASAINAGQSTTLTVSWDGVSSVKDGQVVVEAAGVTGTAPQVHTASLLVNPAVVPDRRAGSRSTARQPRRVADLIPPDAARAYRPSPSPAGRQAGLWLVMLVLPLVTASAVEQEPGPPLRVVQAFPSRRTHGPKQLTMKRGATGAICYRSRNRSRA